VINGKFTMNSQGKLTLSAGATLVIIDCADLKGELVILFDEISQVPTDPKEEVDVVFFDTICGGDKFERVSVEVTKGDSCTGVTAKQVVGSNKLSVLFTQENMCVAGTEGDIHGLPVFAIVLIAVGTVAVIFLIVILSVTHVRQKLFSCCSQRTLYNDDMVK